MTSSTTDPIYDVAVIGAGIIGASSAQHLVSAGYKTVLLERGDYGSGTSSRTSRLQHCGLSYFSPASSSITAFLLNPVFGLKSLELARRAMKGRAEFVKSCPDRVEKITFFVPLTEENAVSTTKARLAFRIMSAFDDGVPLDLKVYTPQEAQSLPVFAGLAGLERIRGAISFTEYQFKWPERIVIDTIVKARAQGLVAHNYTEVVGIKRIGDVWRITGRGRDGTTMTVNARAIANTAGVWVDDITRMAKRDGPVLNTGAKGANVVLKLPEHLRGIGFDTVTSSGMAFYFIPWNDLHYVGPWDTPAEGKPETFRATEEDVQAIVREINLLFPSMPITRSDVLYSWAGVRPRTAAGSTPLGTMEVMEHDLQSKGMPNFVVFTGGLLMTHRDAGRRVTRAIARHLKPSGQAAPIDYKTPSMPDCNTFSRESVVWAIEQEQARTLTGILRRRLAVGWEPDLGLDYAAQTAEIAAPLLGWDGNRLAMELADFVASTAFFFGKTVETQKTAAKKVMGE